MDLNLKIIEGVRQCPILYDTKYTLEERSQAWLMLAEKLKIKEQVLKVRWHYLLRRYLQDSNFRYASKMNFLEDKIGTCQVKEQQYPEFIINEEDLKDDPSEEKAEFHYLVVENEEKTECEITKQKDDSTNTLNESNKNIVVQETTSDITENPTNGHKTNTESCTQKFASSQFENKIQSQRDNEKKETYIESPTNVTNKIDDMNTEKAIGNKIPNKQFSNMDLESVQENTSVELCVESSKEKSEVSKVKSKSPNKQFSNMDLESVQENTSAELCVESSKEKSEVSKVKSKSPNKQFSNMDLESIQENTSVELCVESSKEKSEVSKVKSKSPSYDRCEDDIFGELVSAMLKRMDESKKKNIKKEIMNLLFS